MQNKVVIVAYHYPPENTVGALRPARFARHLKSFGWDPLILTAAEQHSEPEHNILVTPDRSRALWEGQSPVTDPPRPLHRIVELALRRFLLPGALGLSWSTQVIKHPKLSRFLRGSDNMLVFSTFPPLSSHLAARALSRRVRIPWVADFRDPFAHLPGQTLSVTSSFMQRKLEASIIRSSQAVIMNTEAATGEYRRRYPARAEKFFTIWNGYDSADALEAGPLRPGMQRVLVHPGNLYGGRAPTILLESMMRLRAAGHLAALQTHLEFVGPNQLTQQERRAMVEAEGQGWVTNTNRRVSKDKAHHLASTAHGLLIILPLSKTQVPAKVYEYIQIGRPILALAPKKSATADILAQSEVPHVIVHPDDPKSVADRKVSEYLSLPPDPVPASPEFLRKFSAEEQTRQLAAVFDRVMHNPAG